MASERRAASFGTWRAALRQLVHDVGGAERMAKAMWPKRDAEAGGLLIGKWLNPARREKPDIEDVERMLLVGRTMGIHTAINDLCERLNYSRVQPVDPKEKLAALADRIHQHQSLLQEAIDQYKRAKIDVDLEVIPRFKP